jgi:hypothetical protein
VVLDDLLYLHSKLNKGMELDLYTIANLRSLLTEKEENYLFHFCNTRLSGIPFMSKTSINGLNVSYLHKRLNAVIKLKKIDKVEKTYINILIIKLNSINRKINLVD